MSCVRWIILFASVLAVACSQATEPPASPAPSARAAITAEPKPTSTLTFAVGADQARFVATVVRFVDAFNGEDVAAATALLTDDVVGGDCDFARREYIQFRGKAEAVAWLRGRAADHERLKISEIVNSNPDPTTGSHVVAVSWASRTSAVLSPPMGPHGAAKVVFSADGSAIRAFANANPPCDPTK
jgi:hypothetical protein